MKISLKNINHKMTFLIVLFSSNLSFSQQQWFPEKYDSVSKHYVIDTTESFPVTFIKEANGIFSMYGKNTNYETKLTKTEQKTYKSNHLIIPFKNDDEELYANASYTFTLLDNKTGQLIIKRKGKPQKTIRFVLSKSKYININSKYG